MTNERITVRVRGGIESGTVIWRRDDKVRVALRTGKVRTFDASAEWKPIALTAEQRRAAFPEWFGDVTVTAAELALDFSAEAMGHCHGVHMAPMHSRRWP